jgi:hypothetical protein
MNQHGRNKPLPTRIAPRAFIMEIIKIEFVQGRFPVTAFALTSRLGFREKQYRLYDIPLQSGRALLQIRIERRTERTSRLAFSTDLPKSAWEGDG